MKKIFMLLVIFFLVGCSNDKLSKILEENNYIIVDVRTSEEYNENHIKDAINIPLDTIDEKVELDSNKTILVYCKSGKRSASAEKILTDLGYNVYNMGSFDSIDLEKE